MSPGRNHDHISPPVGSLYAETMSTSLVSAPKSRVRSPSTESGDHPHRYKVARAIAACKRCRSKKQKCDGKLPRCSPCEKAKTECIGFDAISKSNVSRNRLHLLEQENAQLRAQVAVLTSGNDLLGDAKRDAAAAASRAISSYRWTELLYQTSPPASDSGRTSQWPYGQDLDIQLQQHSFLGRILARSPISDVPTRPLQDQYQGESPISNPASFVKMVGDATFRTGFATENDSSAEALARRTGTMGEISTSASLPTVQASGHLPGSVQAFRPGFNSTSAMQPLMTAGHKTSPSSIPLLPPQSVVARLVTAYQTFVAVMYPVVHIPSLEKQVQKVREGTQVEHSDIFVVMMVLAMSTMASARFVDSPDELRACSEAFYAEAISHFDPIFKTQDLDGLQAILLLVWYSMLSPGKGSIWFLVGLATRTCVDLGLNDELNIQHMALDAVQLDMRRRLFWCTYEVDRLLSQLLGRPPAIPDGFINVPLPSSLNDADIHQGPHSMPGEACPEKQIFLHITKLRRLQSDILSRNYGVHGTAAPQPAWFERCYQEMQTWLATMPEPRGTVSKDGLTMMYHNSCLLLFRPSPGYPRPDQRALRIVLESSSFIIRAYRRMQLNKRFSWLWMTSHYTFMAGLSFLYAFSNLNKMDGASGAPTLEDAMIDIESSLAILEYLSGRVPSASACLACMQSTSRIVIEEYKKLKETHGDRRSEPFPPFHGGLLPGMPTSPSTLSYRANNFPYDDLPAPLPPTTLPYELRLLDNLILNTRRDRSRAAHYCRRKPQVGYHKKTGTTSGVTHAIIDGISRHSSAGGESHVYPRLESAEANLTPSGLLHFQPPNVAVATGLSYQMETNGGFSSESNATTLSTGAWLDDLLSMMDNPDGSEIVSIQQGFDHNGVLQQPAQGPVGDPQGTSGTNWDPNFDIFNFIMDERGDLSGI